MDECDSDAATEIYSMHGDTDTEAYSVDSYGSDPDYVHNAPSDLDSSPPASDYESADSFFIDDIEDDLPAGVWNPVSDPFNDVRPQPLPEFTGVPGFNLHLDDHPTFTGCVDMYLQESLLQCIVDWTNRRAELYFIGAPEKKNTIHGLKWKPIDPKQLKTFLAYVLNMGLSRKPEIRLYWSTHPATAAPWFRESGLSRDRFLSILKFLRFAEPDSLVTGDRLKRIRPFLTKMQTIFKENYQPNRQICVDESLILYKGRLKFKQFIKSKRSRFGVKVFSLCSSDGYMYNFEIYTGQGDQTFPTPEGTDLSVSERVVTYLMRDLLDLGYAVYTDNWYTSVRLAEYLLTRETLLTGTVRVNRGIPSLVQQERLNTGQTVFARKDNVLVVKYQDKREVHLVTTEHTAGLDEKTRFQSGGGQQMLMQPNVIRQYSKYMQGVDKTDQLMHSYDCTRKSYAWFKKLGLHFFQRALMNSHYVFCQSTGSNMTFLTFLHHTITYLTEGETERIKQLNDDPLSRARRPRPRRRREVSGAARAGGPPLHAADTFPPLPTRAYPQRRCVQCASQNIRKDTRYFCVACPHKPPLCLSCFHEYCHE